MVTFLAFMKQPLCLLLIRSILSQSPSVLDKASRPHVRSIRLGTVSKIFPHLIQITLHARNHFRVLCRYILRFPNIIE